MEDERADRRAHQGAGRHHRAPNRRGWGVDLRPIETESDPAQAFSGGGPSPPRHIRVRRTHRVAPEAFGKQAAPSPTDLDEPWGARVSSSAPSRSLLHALATHRGPRPQLRVFPQSGARSVEHRIQTQRRALFHDRTVGFDAVRVRNPKCNLSKRTDGSWGELMGEQAPDVSVTATRVSGVDFTMTREKSELNKLVITGQFQGRIFRFELDGEQALIRAPSPITLPAVGRSGTRHLRNARGVGARGEAGDDPGRRSALRSSP